MTNTEKNDIRIRSSAPSSWGYGYTHYENDVKKLLDYIEELEQSLIAANYKIWEGNKRE